VIANLTQSVCLILSALVCALSYLSRNKLSSCVYVIIFTFCKLFFCLFT